MCAVVGGGGRGRLGRRGEGAGGCELVTARCALGGVGGGGKDK